MMEPGFPPDWRDVELVAGAMASGRHLHLEYQSEDGGRWVATAEADSLVPGWLLTGIAATPTAAVAQLGRHLRQYLQR